MKAEPPSILEGKEESLSSSTASSYRSASSRAINIPEGLGIISANAPSLYSQSYLGTGEIALANAAAVHIDENLDDQKYQMLKMKYFRSLKVVPPSSGTQMPLAQSAPVIKFSPQTSRSAPIAIPERTRRADDFFYKSPVDDTQDQPEDACQFALEL
jgi:hypothetical protein